MACSKMPGVSCSSSSFNSMETSPSYSATNNFSKDHKIGKGCFGSVYRATLDGGQEVAIKRQGNARAFLIELKALFHLNHKNVAC